MGTVGRASFRGLVRGRFLRLQPYLSAVGKPAAAHEQIEGKGLGQTVFRGTVARRRRASSSRQSREFASRDRPAEEPPDCGVRMPDEQGSEGGFSIAGVTFVVRILSSGRIAKLHLRNTGSPRS